MDEPTNDLDLETLELLEELLLEFQGTLLLVSHDRQFVDNVVTSTLVFEGQGAVNEYVGGYADWLRQRGKSATDKPIAKAKAEPEKTAELKEPKKKLSYKDQRELDLLPQQIEALETERDAINAELADPEAFNQLGSDGMAEKTARLQQIETELEGCLERWMALDS
jgi:ATP-binding cassette subfamily F protein uup